MKERRRLFDAIEHSSDRVRRHVRSFLVEAKVYDERDGVDMASIADEILAVVYMIVHGGEPFLPTPDTTSRRVLYNASLAETDVIAETRWLTQREGGVLSPALRATLKRCRRNGWTVVPPCYVRPSSHNGVAIGLGLFSLIRVQRGQIICQFTGRLERVKGDAEKRAWFEKNAGRANYGIDMRHGIRDYVVNPLDSSDRSPLPHNVAAYINEPSPPPWVPGDVVRVGAAESSSSSSRNALVRAYDHVRGAYDVEFADGTRRRGVPFDLVSDHPLREVQRDGLVSRANCVWHDFPVPLFQLYAPTGRVRSGGDDASQVWMARTDETTTVLTVARDEVAEVYDVYSNGLAFYVMTPKDAQTVVRAGYVLVLKEDVHRGLRRHGQVVSTPGNVVRVVHAINDSVAWRLPPRVIASRVRRCARGDACSDAACPTCEYVPFPVVYACETIPPNREILSFYEEEADASRGVPCAQSLTMDDMGPAWDDL